MSTPLLDMMRAEGDVAMFKAVLTGEEISFVGYSFVHDTDLLITGKHGDTPIDVARSMHTGLDTWEGGLRATGGALAPEK